MKKWHTFGNNSIAIKLKKMTLRFERCNIPFLSLKTYFKYIPSAVEFCQIEFHTISLYNNQKYTELFST